MSMTPTTFQWKIGGEAGMGIKVTGSMFSKMCSRNGMNIVEYSEYPSLIRGGHNTVQILASYQTVRAPCKAVDFLVALNAQTVELHLHEVAPGGLVLYDPADLPKPPRRRNTFWCPVPFLELVTATGGIKLMKNTVSLGATLALMGCQFEILKDIIADTFSKLGKAVDENLAAAKAGFDFVHQHASLEGYSCPIAPRTSKDRMVLAGNEAIALGAMAGGLQAYFAYPMTPSTTILTTLAQHQQTFPMVVRQCEDEISVINEAIGASFAGARTMIGTSGGGFSLMVEAVGLAAMTETPLVIVEAQRPGPSTGLPTWTGQADLRFVLHAAQDDFPRAIFTPGDVEECFYLTAHALNVAELFQIPVFVMTDKFLAESNWSQKMFDQTPIEIHRGELLTSPHRGATPYGRYVSTATGVSPRSIPGVSGRRFIANSDEHDLHGWTSEDHLVRIEQVRKRFRKVEGLKRVMPPPRRYGPAQADVTLVGWGSSKGAMLDARDALERMGRSVNVLHFRSVWPFPKKIADRVLGASKKTLLVEGNYSGQLGGLIEQELHRSFDGALLKYDGRPIYPEEIIDHVKRL